MSLDLANKLITYAEKKPNGFSAELKHNGKDWTIRAIRPSQKKRFAVAQKTIIEVYDDHYSLYPGYNVQSLEFNSPIRVNLYIGGYYNRDKKCYQIEKISLYKYITDALFVAEMLNQISIFDLITKREILVKEAL